MNNSTHKGQPMKVSISRPDLEYYVEEQVKTGHYPTPDAVVEDALDRLQSEDIAEFTPEHDAYIRQRLAEAEDDIRNGRVTSVDEQGLRALCDDVKARGRERLAAKPNQP